MLKTLTLLSLCAAAVAAGCGKSTEAKPSRHHEPPKSVAVPRMPWEGPGPDQQVAMPELSREIMEKVDVKVEEVDVDRLALSVPFSKAFHVAVAVKVVVRSDVERLRILVEPRRFTLLNGKKDPMAMRFTDWKAPALESAYLQTGESATGWLFFLVPEDESKFTLTSDLRREPPIEIPVELPAGK